MARIPDVEIERLKREVSMQHLVEAHGVALKRQGADLVGRCPFSGHEGGDSTPSLHVSTEKNLFHCFGCGAAGSVIDWTMKVGSISFRHAVEILRKSQDSLPRPTVRVLPPPVSVDSDDQKLLDDVTGFYQQTLKESPEALAYLEKRGLRSSEMIDQFKLGFSNRTLGLRLPNMQTKAGEEIRARLQKVGILRDSGHEHMNGSLVIPILDEKGEHTVGMYGRKITDGLRVGTPKHLYLPGPHAGIFNERALMASTEIILCESLIDALTFWCAGFRNVTTSYGVEGFTDEILEGFLKYGTRKVFIAYDRDDAGDRAAEALAAKLMGEEIECFRIHFPRDLDANAYAVKNTPADKMLGILVRNAEWMGKGKPEVVDEKVPVVEKPAAPPPAPPAASEIPAAPVVVQAAPAQKPIVTTESIFEAHGEDLVAEIGDRRFRIRGLEKNTSMVVLKVNLTVRRGDRFHVDTFDLNIARARMHFIKVAATELGLEEDAVKRDVGQVLLSLEQLQDARIQKLLTPQVKEHAMSDEEKAAALALLKDPNLLQRILSDFEKCGMVGEEVNKLTGYIAATSRKLEKPLAVMIQSSSAAGKSSLMDAVLALIPDEEQVRYSAMTGQSLYYMGETNLRHKILALAEEEGAERAAYALKLLQSEGQLTIASTGKDPTSGRLETKDYRVEGPVMIFQTTTAIELDEEFLNRCIVLTVDEGREQTRAIHHVQREQQTRGWIGEKKLRADIVKTHQNAQRLLKPVMVHNPYAWLLTFPDDKTRLRRDHGKYIALINAITLLHQHQRPRASFTDELGQIHETVEVSLQDIEVANRLAHQVLGRSLDELPPQTRQLLMLIEQLAQTACDERKLAREDLRFSRRDVREATGWGNTQLKLHLHRLEELEYLIVHRGGRGQTFVYELAYDGGGKDGTPFLCGLADVERLASEYDEKKSGSGAEKSGGGRGQVGVVSGGSRVLDNLVSPRLNVVKYGLATPHRETAVNGTPIPLAAGNHNHTEVA